MPIVNPFAALRPRPDLASSICELPYDVLSAEEARLLAKDNPLSFFHVSKPEIDLPPETDPYSPAVYAKGKENFQNLIRQGALTQDPAPGFYLYRQTMGDHTQLGLVATASCAEYLNGTIKKHEHTRPDKEDDRVRHIEALSAQTGPAFLIYRSVPGLVQFLEERSKADPGIDFKAPDGVRHTSWMIQDPEAIQFIRDEFTRMPALYIADGHHRTAAAARVCAARNGQGAAAYFLSVLFPHDQLQILPYNRALKDLNGLSPDRLLEKLDPIFILKSEAKAVPSRPHEVCLYLSGRWRTLVFRPHFAAAKDPLERLDVTLLQRHVLGPLFGIDDPRKSTRIDFIGGIRGAEELEKLVDSGAYACAFSMHPTRIEDLMQIADNGGIMPPKSTWFEPKLRDAMFCHLI